jgi:hypothetical protein
MTVSRRRAGFAAALCAASAVSIAAAQDFIPAWMPPALSLVALSASTLILCWPRRLSPVEWACVLLAGRVSRRRLRFIRLAHRHAAMMSGHAEGGK